MSTQRNGTFGAGGKGVHLTEKKFAENSIPGHYEQSQVLPDSFTFITRRKKAQNERKRGLTLSWKKKNLLEKVHSRGRCLSTRAVICGSNERH